MARKCKDWIEGFREFAQPYNTGELFREWLGVWQVSTAVTRQVCSMVHGQATYPNLFLMLVAPPGGGKSQIISAARRVIIPATQISCIPASVTRAGLIDYMVQNLRTRKAPDGTLVPTNECIALSDEINGILPGYEVEHLTLYNELWDNKAVYKARTREKGEYSLQMPYCSIVTGAQPAYLGQLLPEQAWGMGFMRRTIMVFDTSTEHKDAFEVTSVDMALLSKLVADLKEIKNLFGWFAWDDAAKELYREWWVRGKGAPVPQNKRLAMGYNSTRAQNFFKLAMIFSLSRTSEMRVTVKDAARALELLTRTEDRMRLIFAEMSAAGVTNTYGDLIDAVRVRCADGGVMPEADLRGLLMERFQPTQINSIIENLLGSEVLALAPGKVVVAGMRSFVPGRKLGQM